MYTQAIDLKEFYDSVQGCVVQRLLRAHVQRLWPDITGLRLIGLGYSTPYLRSYTGKAERAVALMSARQGAVYWPDNADGLVCLHDESVLPIETNTVDRIIAVHAFQDFESANALLNECWRVLKGQGRILLVVPNRTGIWARVDSTPFGHGVPFSVGQLRSMLRDYNFIPERVERALFVPPSSSRLLLSTAPVWEKVGERFFNAFGGVNIVEATKQLYAGLPVGAATETALARRLVTTSPKPVTSGRLSNRQQ